MKISLNTQIFIGSFLGIAVGIFLNIGGAALPFYGKILYLSDLTGGLFINLLKMVLIPLIFTSVAVGISNLEMHKQMGRVWKITLIYFLVSPALASLLGLICVNLFKPGVGLHLEMFKDSVQHLKVEDVSLLQFFKMFLDDLFMNPFKAMAEGKVLATVVFAIFFGIGLISVGERGRTLKNALNEFYEIVMLIIRWILVLAPVGIMALLIKLVAQQDASLLQALGKFILIVFGATLFHGLVTLPTILYCLTGMTPLRLFSGIWEAMITAFSTSSSNATLPVTLRCVEENLKVDRNIANFILPLGATLNMDGTALYEAIAAVFVANLAGVELNLLQQMIVFATAIIASIGAPGIPSAGMVTMVMVLQSVGLPAEAIAILLPIDRFLDTVRTAVNVQGDAVASVIVQRFTSPSKLEG